MTTRVTCREGVAHLMEYTEGRLGAGLRRKIEAHLHGCQLCQWFVRTYAGIPDAVRSATATHMPARLGSRLRRVVAVARGRGRNR